ncbi:hypothetical protein [Spiroplasma endosymbiont of Seladonia tumulorum]|uniref:hypothetical protein n=1 Tax=Spiroplasma endosymbiont of Seladonia tumulorum TaxID=3066321 RepID=UPI0030D10A97
MKKLLSLLSVLTISGTAVPTTVAASSYQQKENNLENLIIRNKRQNNKQNITLEFHRLLLLQVESFDLQELC